MDTTTVTMEKYVAKAASDPQQHRGDIPKAVIKSQSGAISIRLMASVIALVTAILGRSGTANLQAGAVPSTEEPVPSSQTLAHPCGPICLYFACQSFGIDKHSVQDLAAYASSMKAGSQIERLEYACAKVGLKALRTHLALDSQVFERLFKEHPVRVIAFLKNGHFCYIDQAANGQLRTTRYPGTPEWSDKTALSEMWTGEVILVSLDHAPPSILGNVSSSTSWAQSDYPGLAVLFTGLLSGLYVWVKTLVRTRMKGRCVVARHLGHG